uniref:Putative secreted protein n=1 Tax=Amblyomma triste TaxID=251400 RepID=A0A023G2W6_AMBTT
MTIAIISYGLFFVAWLVICEASVDCYYTKQQMEECDYTTKKQKIRYNLQTNDPKCRPTRVETEDCDPESPSLNLTASENVANVREQQQGRYEFVLREYSASYKFDESAGTLQVTPDEPVRPSLPFSGQYDIVYSTRDCFVLRKTPTSGRWPLCGVWVLKSKVLNPRQECISAFQGSCRSAGDGPIYAPYFKRLCAGVWRLPALKSQ